MARWRTILALHEPSRSGRPKPFALTIDKLIGPAIENAISAEPSAACEDYWWRSVADCWPDVTALERPRWSLMRD